MSERHIIVMEVVVPDLELGEAPWSKLKTGEADIQMCQSWRIDAPAVEFVPPPEWRRGPGTVGDPEKKS